MADPLIELMGKIFHHLPDEGDESLTILKGHLIIEEELFSAISAKIERPSDLKDARLSFYQLMLIAKSIYFKADFSWIWGALKLLNKIRNSMPHALEPEDFRQNVDELIQLVERNHGLGTDLSPEETLRHSLAMIAAYIHGLGRSA